MNLFECKVKYQKQNGKGENKKCTEIYLVDAYTFTEAESNITEEITPFVSGDFEVNAIKKNNYSELFENENGDKYFKCKLNFITLDEKSGVEKKISNYMLVQANNVDEAKINLDNRMKGTMADYEVESISETKIMDVFKK